LFVSVLRFWLALGTGVSGLPFLPGRQFLPGVLPAVNHAG
jgi:hypothetical protein